VQIPSTEQLLYTVVPPLLLLASGAVAAFRTPRAAIRSALLHFAAGVVFAVVAVEIVPDIMKDHQPIETVGGFALGVVAMLGMRALTRKAEGAEAEKEEASGPNTDGKIPGGMIAGVGVDVLIDGLLLGIGFAAGAKEGRLLALALATELVSLGLALAGSLRNRGVSRARTLATVGGVAALFVVGAAGGMLVLGGASSHVLAVVLPFGAAALLFLVTEELLTEAHEELETPWMTAMFFVGFLLFLVLGMTG
jgi:ZIP family zinc transporter